MSHASRQKTSHQEEKMVLAHDPVEGYRPVFCIIFAVSCVYLAYILIRTL